MEVNRYQELEIQSKLHGTTMKPYNERLDIPKDTQEKYDKQSHDVLARLRKKHLGVKNAKR